MKDYIKLLVVLCLFGSVFSSCSEEHYNFPGDSGKIFLREQSSNTVHSIANVINSSISKTILGVSGEAVAAFPIRSTMPVNGSLTATCEIDNSLIESFNAVHGTEYVSMSADKLIFENQSATIENGQMVSVDQIVVKVDPEKVLDLDFGDYLVPIRLVSVSGDMAVSSNWNVVYLHVSVVSDATGVPCADRTGWSVADASSVIDPYYEGNNGAAENVLDGDYSTYWQTEWTPVEVEPPHYITIDMGKVNNLAGVQYVSRNHSLDWPKTMYVEVSTDGTSWEKIAEYEDLPQGANVEFRTLFDELVEARYFRLTITEMYGGRVYTALAEVNAFIMNN